MPDLVIIHTNDMHNRLDAGGAQLLRREREKADALLLDAGDAAWAGNVYYRPGGEPILKTMSGAGYDAMTVGNREFHFTCNGFASKLSRVAFTILCANVRATRGDPVPCVPSVIIERAGLRIGVFGLTVPMVTPGSRAAAFSAYVFDPPLEAARLVVEHLRPRCDVLVALTHVGLTRDRLLAEAAPELDVIAGGHSHDTLERPEYAGGVPIVQAGSHARAFGVVELTRRRGGWDVAGRIEPLPRTFI